MMIVHNVSSNLVYFSNWPLYHWLMPWKIILVEKEKKHNIYTASVRNYV